MCAECSSLRTQVQALLDENAAVLERYEITERGRYAAEREVRRLKGQLNGSTTAESQKVKAVCDYHDELWRRAFPKARGLSYPMDGKNAATVRKVIRWGMSVEEIKLALDGAFASEFHRSKPTYLYLASILGDENRIRNHLTRIGTRSEPARPQPVAADADPLPSEQDIAALAGALQANEEVLTAALRVKGWTPGTLLALGVGFDGQRLVFPVRDSEGTLVSVARYASRQKPKMLAPKGRPRDLFPAPETIQGEELWIVEGEPDAVTAHQLGLPAVGVPGAAKWQDDWMPRLAASRVVVCFDCDEAGRRAAERVRSEIASMPHPSDVRVLDLDPNRTDGFDLTDFVLAGGTVEQLRNLPVPLRSAA
jgi:hypothetical protein